MTRNQFYNLKYRLCEELNADPFGWSIDDIIKIKFPKEFKKLLIIKENSYNNSIIIFNSNGILYLKLLEKLTFNKK